MRAREERAFREFVAVQMAGLTSPGGTASRWSVRPTTYAPN